MKEKNYGVIKYKGIDFHYYIYGHRGGKGLAVYKEYLEDNNKKWLPTNPVRQRNTVSVNFASWHFEPKEEATKIIKDNFKILNK